MAAITTLLDTVPQGRHVVAPDVMYYGTRDWLKRLEQKGLVASKLGESTPERGGRAKRFFRLKPNGLKALRESREMFLSLWRDYETLLDNA